MLQNSIKAARKNAALGNVYCRTGGHFLHNSPSKHAGVGITIVDQVGSAALQLYGKVLLFLFEGWEKGCD